MADVRVTQEHVQVAHGTEDNARVTQEHLQVVHSTPSNARLSQYILYAVTYTPDDPPRLHGRRASLSFGRTLGK